VCLTFKGEEEDIGVTNAAAVDDDDDDDIPGAAETTEDREHMVIVMMVKAITFCRSSNFIFLEFVFLSKDVEDLTIVPFVC
jgi:hypothetical protein